jgi:outer membrane protein TolC
MKRRVLFAAFVFLGLCAPALAGQNWVDQFLNRYKPSSTSSSSLPLTQDRLPGLIQSGQIPLSVTDLINLTLENNLDISVNRFSPIESEYAIRTNYRPFEPTLRLGFNFNNDRSVSRTQLTGVNAVGQTTDNINVGYSQTLQTGTDLKVDFTLDRLSSNNAFNTFNPSWVGQITYGFTQHLLNGKGRNVNTRSIRIAQNNKTISEVQFERSVIDLVTQAQKSYWDLVFTTEDLKVKQDSYQLAQKTLSDNQRQVDVGTMARIDLIQSRSQVATRHDELIVSTFSLDQIQDQIKKVLSRQPDPGLVVAKLVPTQLAGNPGDSDILPIEAAIRVALENRPELRQARLQLNNSEIDVEYAKNQLLPTLDVQASLSHTGIGGKETLRDGFFPNAPIISVTNGGIGDAFGNLLKFQSRGYTLGFTMQIPLSNKSQQAEYSRVVTGRRSTQENIKALEQQIALEVRTAINGVEMNKARIETVQTASALASEQYAAEQRRFELGASTLRFVLEEQRNLEQAKTNEIAAAVNYRKALVDYDHALGVTLKKNNVSIDKPVAMK